MEVTLLAIGAAKSNPKSQVAITGDGSIELNILELKTLSIHKLLKLLLLTMVDRFKENPK